ncbi:hypothetical protein GCM10011274_14610 [Paraglaciecola chathamensis]|uniref:Uncharacterized protein n=1 Tax=Paraglaciecola chathamensis TaxID=368405 RepID=A0A8H9I8B3_9ALTE|nr:hypothetical protein GCM10011274_14610 [Paraglaciecola oceanifecundans]
MYNIKTTDTKNDETRIYLNKIRKMELCLEESKLTAINFTKILFIPSEDIELRNNRVAINKK